MVYADCLSGSAAGQQKLEHWQLQVKQPCVLSLKATSLASAEHNQQQMASPVLVPAEAGCGPASAAAGAAVPALLSCTLLPPGGMLARMHEPVRMAVEQPLGGAVNVDSGIWRIYAARPACTLGVRAKLAGWILPVCLSGKGP